ncbi:MAG: hypothetical protein AVDCRST_MAG93-7069 [uncultured Chloroflexia bacterium]|uniref:Uncharacterized protein n=1 Tax=uncultured Chloroflexia bacterium TaxID=1672391 RepID=A0A6J4M4U6_9CHLR|nr:MAG: hypothetical protein AVDCRST_MAG93-7069 [uncultured Chloroflexia bacterium]
MPNATSQVTNGRGLATTKIAGEIVHRDNDSEWSSLITSGTGSD